MLARKFHLFKDRGITAMATVLAEQGGEAAMGVSSRADTWLLLRSVEVKGRRTRLLFVLKSRGTAHSDEVREFALTGHGVELFDVYVGPGGEMTGSARRAQTDGERPGQLVAEEDELTPIAGHKEGLAVQAQASRRAMAAQRWADPDAYDHTLGHKN
jgi:circadian clock protein KaiC